MKCTVNITHLGYSYLKYFCMKFNPAKIIFKHMRSKKEMRDTSYPAGKQRSDLFRRYVKNIPNYKLVSINLNTTELVKDNS